MVSMTRGYEEALEDDIIKMLVDRGWIFVNANELGRNNIEDPLIQRTFEKKIKEFNKDSAIGREEVQQAINLLRSVGHGPDGAKIILRHLKYGIPIRPERESTVKYIQLFNYSDHTLNDFIVSRQVVYKGLDEIRTDIILYVNGIPLVNIELKDPQNMSVSWTDARDQIIDYMKFVPELYKYVQIGVGAEQIARYFPIVPWQYKVDKTHGWREKDPSTGEDKEPIEAMCDMFLPERLLDYVRNFIFFREEHGEAGKVVPRYMQYRAVNKIYERVTGNLKGEHTKDKGLIWHWQGSGKTLTMIFAAHKLYHEGIMENPSVFFIIDRKGLEEQMFNELNAIDMERPEKIESVSHLRSVLRHDNYRGKRGLMIALVHKFRPEELKNLQKELEELSKTQETVMSRKNIVGLIDEGHRTQYGTLASQMKKILKSAFFFALTGTPIAKQGRDTYSEFSYPEEDEHYLDKYFITDSIKDGFTVKIAYQPRLGEEVRLKRELLEAFLDTEFDDVDDELRDELKDAVKKKINIINAYLEQKDRIHKIAEDIAEHFKENVNGKFKGMVVACSRKACVIYKKYLDEFLPPEYSEIVMTYQAHENDDNIVEYKKTLLKKYGNKDTEDINKDIVERYKEEELPKILVVTSKLLTGFDAPILQTMYLDKPLKEHRLLQAVARTNRPFKDLKEAGLIIDYIGVLEEIDRAFEIYSKDDYEGAVYPIDEIKEEFQNTINDLLGILTDVPYGKIERATLIKSADILTTDPDAGKVFLTNYRKLRRLFELLGSDELKLEWLKEYKWLSAIYRYYLRQILGRQPDIESHIDEYFKKTVDLIHETTEVTDIEKDLPIFEFGVDYLEEIEKKVSSREEKAANMAFILNRMVLVEKHRNPIFESLVEKVERIMKLWRERTKDYETIYQSSLEVFKEMDALSEEQKELGLSNLEYSILINMRSFIFGDNPIDIDIDRELIKEIKKLYVKIDTLCTPGWYNLVTAVQEVEKEVRRYSRRSVVKYNLKIGENRTDSIDNVFKEIWSKVELYGKKD